MGTVLLSNAVKDKYTYYILTYLYTLHKNLSYFSQLQGCSVYNQIKLETQS